MPEENQAVDENTQAPVDGDTDIEAAKAKAAEILAQSQEDKGNGKKPSKAKGKKAKPEATPAPELTPEELAAKQEAEAQALAEAQATLEAKQAEIGAVKTALVEAEAKVTELKAKLRELQGKSAGAANRGPVGVGAFIKDLITQGLSNAEILEKVKAEWPDNNTNVGCINWYRNALKNWPNGKRPVKAKAEAAATEVPEVQTELTDGQTEAEAPAETQTDVFEAQAEDQTAA